jgi:hypothetical protein
MRKSAVYFFLVWGIAQMFGTATQAAFGSSLVNTNITFVSASLTLLAFLDVSTY